MAVLNLPRLAPAAPVRRPVIPQGEDLIAREAQKAANLFQGVFLKIADEVRISGVKDERERTRLDRKQEAKDDAAAAALERTGRGSALNLAASEFDAGVKKLGTLDPSTVTPGLVNQQLGAILDKAASRFPSELGQAQFQGLRDSLETQFPDIAAGFAEDVAKAREAEERKIATRKTNNEVVSRSIALRLAEAEYLSNMEEKELGDLEPEKVAADLTAILDQVLGSFTSQEALDLFEQTADGFRQAIPGQAIDLTKRERAARASTDVSEAFGQLANGATLENYHILLGDLNEGLRAYDGDLTLKQQGQIFDREAARIVEKGALRSLRKTPLAAAEVIYSGELSPFLKGPKGNDTFARLETSAATAVNNHMLERRVEVLQFQKGLSQADIDEAGRLTGSTGHQLKFDALTLQGKKVADYEALLADRTVTKSMSPVQLRRMTLEASETTGMILEKAMELEQGIAVTERRAPGAGRRNAAHVRSVEAADKADMGLQAQFATWVGEIDRISEMAPAGSEFPMVSSRGIPTGGTISQDEDRGKLMAGVTDQMAAGFIDSIETRGFVSTPWAGFMRSMLDADTSTPGSSARLKSVVMAIGSAMESVDGALVSPTQKANGRGALGEFLERGEFGWIYSAYKAGADPRSIQAARDIFRDKDRRNTLSEQFKNDIARMAKSDDGDAETRLRNMIVDDIGVDPEKIPGGVVIDVMNEMELHYQHNNGILPDAIESAWREYGSAWNEENGRMIKGGITSHGEWAPEQLNARLSGLTNEAGDQLTTDNTISVPLPPGRPGAIPQGFDPSKTYMIMHDDGTYRQVEGRQGPLYHQVDWGSSPEGVRAQNQARVNSQNRMRAKGGRVSLRKVVDTMRRELANARTGAQSDLDAARGILFTADKAKLRAANTKFKRIQRQNDQVYKLSRQLLAREISAPEATKIIEGLIRDGVLTDDQVGLFGYAKIRGLKQDDYPEQKTGNQHGVLFDFFTEDVPAGIGAAAKFIGGIQSGRPTIPEDD